ncbi:Uncharacterized conserved protein, DUF849 family [Dethiosulfatibacter aminovorans DSM 17477]|uniref:Uncharacterized conserved protein, DUF849 family n=1 Tax=Dethiosulfatibacter aminovorans DSM 17477 TaxID=1121476 RepID=A0A1M6BIY6_9FIRM|nr:3-keto-5-aminohexanoate cleavage protein [Dethiosulfatibacter aminovorans]SHI48679.1 Uncharacterized conserved protein, DUF849 family [Dethiosulfatibacter aminovorans DSM 17477]
MKKLIINLAPTGMVPTKEMTVHVPVTPEEIFNDVDKCVELGVSMVHLHARDDITGNPTYKKEVYERIIYKIREKHPNLVLVGSTSGRNFSEFEKRSQVLDIKGDLKPDMASLTMGSMNFMKVSSVNSPDMIQKLAYKMLENGIKPEIEIFSSGMLKFTQYLIKKELLKPPYYINVLVGNIATMQDDLLDIGVVKANLPEDSYFSIAGLGKCQKDMNILGMAVAHGVRTGVEDYIWMDSRKKEYATNYKLVKRVRDVADIMDIETMKPEELRNILDLEKKVI